MKRSVIIWIIIAIIYFGAFGFLSVYDFGDWQFRGFAQNLIGVFLGAGAIGIITAIILIFQYDLQARREKNTEVFKQKIDLYQSIIRKMEKIFDDGKIDDKEEERLFFNLLKVLLISKPETIESYTEMFKTLCNKTKTLSNKTKIEDDDKNKLLEFIRECRKDLDVLKDVEDQQNKIREVISGLKEMEIGKWHKIYYNDWDHYKKEVLDQKGLSDEIAGTVKEIHDDIKSKYELSQNNPVRYSKRMISFFTAGNNRRFMMITILSKNGFKLVLQKDKKEPVPGGAEERKSHPDTYQIDIKERSAYNEKVKGHIKKSYDYIKLKQ